MAMLTLEGVAKTLRCFGIHSLLSGLQLRLGVFVLATRACVLTIGAFLLSNEVFCPFLNLVNLSEDFWDFLCFPSESMAIFSVPSDKLLKILRSPGTLSKS